MPDPVSPPPTNALLRTAYNAVSARIFAGVKAGRDFDDLRPAHGNAMEQLELEDGLRLTEMAARAGITVQSMGELVDDLETKGYLERRADPTDRRAKRIRAQLVERGMEVSEIQVMGENPAAKADELDNVGFVFFSDPDGDGWAVQQISARG